MWFGLNQWSLDWKYNVLIDYVCLLPCTKAQFFDLKNRQKQEQENEEMPDDEQPIDQIPQNNDQAMDNLLETEQQIPQNLPQGQNNDPMMPD